MNGAFEEQVRQRAYQIWMELGQAEGQAQDHWIAAELHLLTDAAKEIAVVPSTAKSVKSAQRGGATSPVRKAGKVAAVKVAATKSVKAKPAGGSTAQLGGASA